jgi:hypothetical protein
MTSKSATSLLIEDCWQELFKLQKTLAEVKRVNAEGWAFLKQARRPSLSADVADFSRIDPAVWRKRAEEARALADVTGNAGTKNALLEIAKSYEDLAASKDISDDDTAV